MSNLFTEEIQNDDAFSYIEGVNLEVDTSIQDIEREYIKYENIKHIYNHLVLDEDEYVPPSDVFQECVISEFMRRANKDYEKIQLLANSIIKIMNICNTRMVIDEHPNKYTVEHNKKQDKQVWNVVNALNLERSAKTRHYYISIRKNKKLREKSARLIQKKYLERYYSSNNKRVLEMKNKYFNI
jgi:hypothetical protein